MKTMKCSLHPCRKCFSKNTDMLQNMDLYVTVDTYVMNIQ